MSATVSQPVSLPPVPPPVPAETMSRATVKSRAVTGTFWSLGAQFSQQGIRLASNVVMARFLDPSAFGLMQLVNLVLRGLQMTSDIGVGPSIVQHPRGKEEVFLQTAWTVQALRAMSLALIGISLAYPAALFLTREQPQYQSQLAWLIAAAAAVGFISAFNSTSLHTAARDMNIRRLTVMELSISVVTLVSMVFFAWQFKSVWALVLGTAVTGLTRMVFSHAVLPGIRHRFRWEPHAVSELFGFGRWVFISTLMTFLALQTDRVLIQKLFANLELLGIYGIALQLATLPVDVAQGLSSSILMPMYSRLKRDGRVPASVYNQVAVLTSTLGGIVVAGMVGVGPAFVRMAYEGKYESAAQFLQALGTLAWMRVLQNNTGAALMAVGQSRSSAISNTVKFIAMLVLVPAAYFGAQHVWRASPETQRDFNSLIAVIIAFSVTEAAKYLILARDAAKQGLSPFANDIRATMYLGVVVLAILGLQIMLERAKSPAWSELLICGIVAVALYAPAITNALRRISPAMSFKLPRRDPDPREAQATPAARPGVRQLRINFVLPTPDLSGGVKSNRLIGEAMVRRGHIVNILYPAAPETWPAPWRVRTMLRRTMIEINSFRQPRHHLAHSVANIMPVMAHEIHADDVPNADVTIGTWWETMHWVDKFPASKGIHAYFVRAHELFGGRPELVRETYLMPAKKLVISTYLQRIMAQEYADNEAALIPNGVDWGQFNSTPRGKQAVPTVGIQYSHAGFKDINTGLAALRIVREKMPQARIIAFGSAKISSAHTLPEGTEFYHRPEQALIPSLYRMCDCWVLSSTDEGFGMPGIEAAACRTPVVSTRSGGPEDYVVDGITGFLVNQRDPQALADRILRVLNLPEHEWRAMSEAAYAKAHDFNWDHSAERLEAVLLAEVEKSERTAQLLNSQPAAQQATSPQAGTP